MHSSVLVPVSGMWSFYVLKHWRPRWIWSKTIEAGSFLIRVVGIWTGF